MTFRKLVLRAALLGSSLAVPAFAAEPAPPPSSPPQQQAQTPEDAHRPVMDVVFVLDTTSSMSGLIEGAKEKIWSIASRMASGKPSPRIRVGLVGFRDRGDAYITKRFDLTEDLDVVYANLRAFQAEGGGDGPEHVGQALGEAVKLMSWTDDRKAARMIFLVGDAPGHDDYQDGWNTAEWAKKAIAKGIVVNTIRCGSQPDTAALFTRLSKLADGTYVSIAQSGGMVATTTPYDAEMAKLNAAIADKTLVGGSADARAAGESELGGLKAMSASTASDRVAYKTKAAPAAPAATKVHAGGAVTLNLAPEKVNTLKDAELPEVLRAMPKDKREGYVRGLNEEQKQLQAQLVELSNKRDTYLKAEAAKKPATSFDDQVFEGVKRAAKKADIAYE